MERAFLTAKLKHDLEHRDGVDELKHKVSTPLLWLRGRNRLTVQDIPAFDDHSLGLFLLQPGEVGSN